jgi:hypothetical protein
MAFSASSPFDEIDELNFILNIGKNKVGKSIGYGDLIILDLKDPVQLPGTANLTIFQGLGSGQEKLSSPVYNFRAA